MDAFKNSLGSTMGKLAACGGCLFLVVIGIAVMAAAGSSASKSSGNPTSIPAKSDNATTTTQATSQTTTATVQATPQVLLDLTGSGTKSTQKFTAAGDWDLNWSYDCTKFTGGTGNFQVYVYNGDGSMSIENGLVNQLGASGSDVEHYHKGGTFYLEVNSECSWHIAAKG